MKLLFEVQRPSKSKIVHFMLDNMVSKVYITFYICHNFISYFFLSHLPFHFNEIDHCNRI